MKIALLICIVLLLPLALVSLGAWSFQRKWDTLQQSLRALTQTKPSDPITDADLQTLPRPVQNWLRWSGIVGHPRLSSVHLFQTGSMRLNPTQKGAMSCQSEQWIAPLHPSFIWRVRTRMFGVPILGRDTFSQGEGSMWISLFGLFPVVHVTPNSKTNQSALQRFLGEIIWAPSAALHPAIVWKERDETSAEATMTVGDTQGSAIFYFLPSGEPSRFVAQRFKDIEDVKPLEWVATITATREFAGLRLPSAVATTWMLPEGPFTWFTFTVDSVEFDQGPDREPAFKSYIIKRKGLPVSHTRP